MITIRKAAETDLQDAESIRYEMLKEVNCLPDNAVFDEVFVNNTAEYFRSKDQTTLLAYDGERVVGCATICYILLMPTFDHPGGKRAHIMNVYTRAAYRRQGIAFRMIKILIDEAVGRNVTEISLDSTREGRPLYEKCGFAPSEEGMILQIDYKRESR